MRMWRRSEGEDGPKRRTSDQQNTLINWAVGVVGSAVVLGATLYVQGIAATAKEAKEKAALVSEQQVGTTEAIKGVESKIQNVEKQIDDFKVEQRATNKEIKDKQDKTLDLLIRMDRKNR